jgi:hypothetical protein
MRMMLNVSLPVEKFNASVRDGTAGQKLKQIMDDIKPEAVYFTEQMGQRTAVLVVNMRESSDVPKVAEPFFLNWDADVEMRICMTPDDLEKAGLEALGKKWG